MILGIDASNIRGGGGVTHLVEMLGASTPDEFGFDKVIIWSGKPTLDKIADREWLEKRYLPILDKGLLYRMYWQKFRLSRHAIDAKCSLLFAPGGSYSGGFHPVVTMSQNLLPFEWKELRRYRISFMTFKLLVLRLVQTNTFKRSEGIIFLTEYAFRAVKKVAKGINCDIAVIPHGISNRFKKSPRAQLPAAAYSVKRPIKLVYVSIIDMYKHQWNVAEAVALLRSQGIPVSLDLIGPAYAPALDILKAKMKELDPKGDFINYHGPVKYQQLHEYLQNTDIYVFASSCENMPNILLEGMAAGLPIACSDMGPMPEVLKDAGFYFNPLNAKSIAEALKTMIFSDNVRAKKAAASFDLATGYSWEKCASRTFSFLQQVALKN